MGKKLNLERFQEMMRKHFINNIKLTFLTSSSIILLTKDDKLYNFDILHDFYLFLDPNEEDALIRSALIEEICNKGIVHIETGHFYAIVRTRNGQIYCWGDNNYGQLGIGSTSSSKHKPELNQYLKSKNVIYICCGVRHSLALTVDGDVYSWGDNTYGQVGNGTFEKVQTIPSKIDSFNNKKIKAIACGGNHSFALTESNEVYSWGNNKYGQLGYGNYKDSNSPTRVLIEFPIEKICCGRFHSILLSKEGDVYTFEDNFSYKNSNINGTEQSGIVKFKISEKIQDIAAHPLYNDSFSVTVNDIYYMWSNCDRENIIVPKKTEFKSFNEIFLKLHGVTLKPIKFLPNFQKSLFSNGYYEDHYKEIEKFAEGSYGNVYKVEDHIHETYALKKYIFDVENVECILKELKIYFFVSKLKDNYIVDHIMTWIEESNNSINENYKRSATIYILMELYEKTLADIIDEVNECKILKTENDTYIPICYFLLSQLFIQILEGVNYLHKQNPPIIHRNLKPENILLNKVLKGRLVRISGFHLATFHEFAEQSHSKDVGSPSYIAPEVIKSQKYDVKADIFSLGAIMEDLFDLDINR
jgi:hypothetical protein